MYGAMLIGFHLTDDIYVPDGSLVLNQASAEH